MFGLCNTSRISSYTKLGSIATLYFAVSALVLAHLLLDEASGCGRYKSSLVILFQAELALILVDGACSLGVIISKKEGSCFPFASDMMSHCRDCRPHKIAALLSCTVGTDSGTRGSVFTHPWTSLPRFMYTITPHTLRCNWLFAVYVAPHKTVPRVTREFALHARMCSRVPAYNRFLCTVHTAAVKPGSHLQSM